jgi:hypothetical protein
VFWLFGRRAAERIVATEEEDRDPDAERVSEQFEKEN